MTPRLWDSRKVGLPTSHSENGISKSFHYDTLGRVIDTEITVDGATYTIGARYDEEYGRPKALIYPNGLTVGLAYNDAGFLVKEYNAASGYVYRQVTERDYLGNVTASCLAGSANSDCIGNNSNFIAVTLKLGQLMHLIKRLVRCYQHRQRVIVARIAKPSIKSAIPIMIVMVIY